MLASASCFKVKKKLFSAEGDEKNGQNYGQMLIYYWKIFFEIVGNEKNERLAVQIWLEFRVNWLFEKGIFVSSEIVDRVELYNMMKDKDESNIFVAKIVLESFKTAVIKLRHALLIWL